MPRAIEVPEGLASFFSDPSKVQQAIDLLNGLSALQAHLVTASNSASIAPGKSKILGDPGAMILPIPLKLSAPIADSTATAASVSAQLNLLLAALRATSQLPT